MKAKLEPEERPICNAVNVFRERGYVKQTKLKFHTLECSYKLSILVLFIFVIYFTICVRCVTMRCYNKQQVFVIKIYSAEKQKLLCHLFYYCMSSMTHSFTHYDIHPVHNTHFCSIAQKQGLNLNVPRQSVQGIPHKMKSWSAIDRPYYLSRRP